MCSVVEERAPASVSNHRWFEGQPAVEVLDGCGEWFRDRPWRAFLNHRGGTRSFSVVEERASASVSKPQVRACRGPSSTTVGDQVFSVVEERAPASVSKPQVRACREPSSTTEEGPGRLETTGSGFDRLNRREFGLLPGLRREPVMTGAATGPPWQAGRMATREQPWSDEPWEGGSSCSPATRSPRPSGPSPALPGARS